MRLQCKECGVWHDIPEDKMDDYNIYRKWNGFGSLVMCKPCLLCPACSEKCYEKAVGTPRFSLCTNS